jgi:hypothetical protein
MELLKRFWTRIVSAYAVPPSGHGKQGGVPLDQDTEPIPHSADYVETSRGHWKSRGGFRK